MIDWTAHAKSILAEVGLTFDDVYDLGRPWWRGPEGFAFIVGRPNHRGIYHPANRENPTSRKRALIGLTGSVDSEIMLAILAHECAHAKFGHGGSSTPEYVEEYHAEIYALRTILHYLGRPAHPWIISQCKRNVRRHCWHRFRALGAEPTKGWDTSVIEWCGFNPGVKLGGY